MVRGLMPGAMMQRECLFGVQDELVRSREAEGFEREGLSIISRLTPYALNF
jgi:hypothetical protein